MEQEILAQKPSILAGLLVAASTMVLHLSLTRTLLWAFGFPQGSTRFFIGMASLALVVLLLFALLRKITNLRIWTSWDAWTRRDILIFCVAGGCLFGVYAGTHMRIRMPDLSFAVTFEGIIEMLVTGAIGGAIVGAFAAFVVKRKQT